MLQMKARVSRSFYLILSGLTIWVATGSVPPLLLTDQVLTGAAVALLAAISAFLMVVRHRGPSGEVSVFMSGAILLGGLVMAMPPLVLVIALAKYLPYQYSALILLYVMGIVAFVAAAAVQLRRGIIEHKRGQGPTQGVISGRRGGT